MLHFAVFRHHTYLVRFLFFIRAYQRCQNPISNPHLPSPIRSYGSLNCLIEHHKHPLLFLYSRNHNTIRHANQAYSGFSYSDHLPFYNSTPSCCKHQTAKKKSLLLEFTLFVIGLDFEEVEGLFLAERGGGLVGILPIANG